MQSLTVQNLTYYYNSFLAIDQLNFTLQKNEVVGFIGVNGAGKSTTLKILAGLQPDYQGNVFFDSEVIAGNSIAYKSKIGYLAESNPLYLSMYIKEFLLLSARLHKINNPYNRIKKVIDQVGLNKHTKKKIGHLSKGLKQRVGIAQAILHKPEILILDEPISGLDPNQILEIRTLIRNLSQDRIIIYSSHLLSEIESNCDRALLIDKGKIIANKSKQEFKNAFGKSTTIELKTKYPISRSTFLNEFPDLRIVESNENTYAISSEEKFKDLNEKLFYFATKINNPILEMKTSQEDMISIFRKLTNAN